MNIQEALEVADNIVVEFINPAEQDALMALAAAYRELTTPVSEAPEGSVVVYGCEEGSFPKNAMICIHHKERGKFSFLPIPEVKV